MVIVKIRAIRRLGVEDFDLWLQNLENHRTTVQWNAGLCVDSPESESGNPDFPLVRSGVSVGPLVDTVHELSFVASSLGWNPKRVFPDSWTQEKAARNWMVRFVMKSREETIVEIPTIVFDHLWRDRNCAF